MEKRPKKRLLRPNISKFHLNWQNYCITPRNLVFPWWKFSPSSCLQPGPNIENQRGAQCGGWEAQKGKKLGKVKILLKISPRADFYFCGHQSYKSIYNVFTHHSIPVVGYNLHTALFGTTICFHEAFQQISPIIKFVERFIGQTTHLYKHNECMNMGIKNNKCHQWNFVFLMKNSFKPTCQGCLQQG